MANRGLVSQWYTRDDGFEALLKLLCRGDLIEFQRGRYCHWAVYIGSVMVEEDGDDDSEGDGLMVSDVPMVAHRANPAEEQATGGIASVSVSRSLSKGSLGLGDICIEKLRDVWSDGQARINNGLDSEIVPFEQDLIVERAFSAVYDRHGNNLLRCYNVLTNNCEHFATWARNGWAISQQVTRRLRQGLQIGALVVTGLLPRPLSIAAGLGMVGLQALQQIRRN